MVAVIFDIKKWLDRVTEPYKSEISYLRERLTAREDKLQELERMIFKRAGFISDSTVTQASEEVIQPVGRVRTWKDKKALLEAAHKQRPIEYIEREKRFRAAAEQGAVELQDEMANGTEAIL